MPYRYDTSPRESVTRMAILPAAAARHMILRIRSFCGKTAYRQENGDDDMVDPRWGKALWKQSRAVPLGWPALLYMSKRLGQTNAPGHGATARHYCHWKGMT